MQEIKVTTENVGRGMYINRLDRPWIDTPFLLQGFLVQDQDDIDMLRKHCEYVYVDPSYSKIPFDLLKKLECKSIYGEEKKELSEIPSLFKEKYKISVPVEEEIKVINEGHTKLCSAIYDTLDDIRKGNKISISELERSVDPMIDSMIRNPDAISYLAKIKQKDNYTYNHSLSTSITAVVFGRHLGLPKEDLKALALGAMLLDIGKIKLPDTLLSHQGKLSEAEFEMVKHHVKYGMDILHEANSVDDRILSLVWTHHERHNGQGYPQGLKGNEIPIFGKIAAIVDCYDAITSARPFSTALPPHEAIKKLYEWRNHAFQAEMIEEFIQAIGVFPIGSLVELTSGEVGIIISQNRQRRLKPKVMLILDAHKETLGCFITRDLSTESDAKGQALEIKRSLERGAFGINPQDFYI